MTAKETKKPAAKAANKPAARGKSAEQKDIEAMAKQQAAHDKAVAEFDAAQEKAAAAQRAKAER